MNLKNRNSSSRSAAAAAATVVVGGAWGGYVVPCTEDGWSLNKMCDMQMCQRKRKAYLWNVRHYDPRSRNIHGWSLRNGEYGKTWCVLCYFHWCESYNVSWSEVPLSIYRNLPNYNKLFDIILPVIFYLLLCVIQARSQTQFLWGGKGLFSGGIFERAENKFGGQLLYVTMHVVKL